MIENNVWLGARSIVLQDSVVRNKAIIGAGSVFKGVSDENSIYLGMPARKTSERKLNSEYHLSYKSYFR